MVVKETICDDGMNNETFSVIKQQGKTKTITLPIFLLEPWLSPSHYLFWVFLVCILFYLSLLCFFSYHVYFIPVCYVCAGKLHWSPVSQFKANCAISKNVLYFLLLHRPSSSVGILKISSYHKYNKPDTIHNTVSTWSAPPAQLITRAALAYKWSGSDILPGAVGCG